MAQAVLAFGANLGNRTVQITEALRAVNRLPQTCVTQVSSAYETPAFGVPDEQPDYINCCAVVETNLSPHALLGGCLGIEAAMGRERIGEKSARVIDIDLLFYEQVEERSQELILPHPFQAPWSSLKNATTAPRLWACQSKQKCAPDGDS